ncbi:MAG: hypothetical protein JST44_27360 [Cyanobacteria bacterium SZAS LIN-5]|nr:hypothetical protein [Cyanobacteria bacterium SZAS LIN-5]
MTIKQSTAEILGMDENKLIVSPTQANDLIVLVTNANVRCDIGVVTRRGRTVEVLISRHEHRDRPVVIDFD